MRRTLLLLLALSICVPASYTQILTGIFSSSGSSTTPALTFSCTQANVNPLPAPWQVSGSFQPLQIISNNCVVTSNNTYDQESYNSATPNNQKSVVTVGSVTAGTTSYVWPTVRDDGAGDFYTCFFGVANDAHAYIYKVSGSAFGAALATFNYTYATGDKPECDVSGSTITAKSSMADTLGTATDASYTTGIAGFGTYTANTTTVQVTTWCGGALTASC